MNAPADAAAVALLVLDVDGVLTDGRLWFGADGEALKPFHARDGLGIKLLQEAGIAVAVISGRTSPAVTARMRDLSVEHVVQGAADKGAALRDLLDRLGVPARRVACLVDDIPDLPLMRQVGVPAAVSDAHPDVLSAARHVTVLPGGHGAVREFCDWLLAARRPPPA